jgi:hypothetical protein
MAGRRAPVKPGGRNLGNGPEPRKGGRQEEERRKRALEEAGLREARARGRSPTFS